MGSCDPRNLSVARLLQEKRWDLLEEATPADESQIREIEEALPKMDWASKGLVVAYLSKQTGLAAARLLLRMTADPDPQVAGSAAHSLAEAPELPPGKEIAAAVESCTDPFARSYFYLALGKCGPGPWLTRLKEEREDSALPRAEAARARLGDETGLSTLIRRLESALPEEAEELAALAVYTGVRKVARGLIPWCSREDPVRVLDPHTEPDVIRMRDLAAWAAGRLGIPPSSGPEILRRRLEEIS